MGRPRLFGRNFFSTRIYPLHVLTPTAAAGAGEVAGNEFARIGNACQDPLDYWTTEQANTEARGKVTCDRQRAADMCAIGRGHNLSGKQVVLECSEDDFVSPPQTVFDVVLPTVSAAGALDDAFGVRTPDGAWLKKFPPRSATSWRLRIPALGVGLAPRVVTAWLDLSWSPEHLDLPTAPHAHELGAEETQTSFGWIGRAHPWARRRGHVSMRLASTFDYDLALEHIQYQFGLNRPMWIVHDDAEAQAAVLAVPVLGTIEIVRRSRQHFYPTVSFDWIEHEPRGVV